LSELARTAGVVPGFAADFIQRLGCPLHDVERVGALHRSRATLRDDTRDPAGLISGHVRDQLASRGAEQVKEPAQRRPVVAWRGPDQPAAVVINHDSQIPVPALVGDLIDPDPHKPVQAITKRFNVSPDPGDDRADRPPRDPHQLSHRRL